MPVQRAPGPWVVWQGSRDGWCKAIRAAEHSSPDHSEHRAAGRR